MKYAAIVASLLVASAIKINNNFAAGVEDEEMPEPAQDGPSREETFAMTAARLGSGVRARWVELPDCPAGKPNATAGEYALADDLSNAIIATCKVERAAGWKAPNATYAFGDSVADLNKLGLGPDANKGATPKTYISPAIYDPVVHVDRLIPTAEHQVTQQ